MAWQDGWRMRCGSDAPNSVYDGLGVPRVGTSVPRVARLRVPCPQGTIGVQELYTWYILSIMIRIRIVCTFLDDFVALSMRRIKLVSTARSGRHQEAGEAIYSGDSECEVHLRPSRSLRPRQGICLQAWSSAALWSTICRMSLAQQPLRCEHCFGDVRRYGTDTRSQWLSCPRGCSAVCCSDLCRGEDFRYWGHEMALTAAPGASALRAHAVKSESLGAESDPESLDRFGALLLAVRCLWRHHGSGSTQHNARPQLPSSLSSVEFNREEEEEHILFERLAHGPSLPTWLISLSWPPKCWLPATGSLQSCGDNDRCLRANYASFTDEVGTIIGAGCYAPVADQPLVRSQLRPELWSARPCERAHGGRSCRRGTGDHIHRPLDGVEAARELWQRYGFECDCIRCMRDGDGDAIGYRQRDEEDINALLEAAQQAQAREREMPWRLLEESAR